MSFIAAEWRKLVIANYAIDESLLHPFLPAKTEIDKWNGTCYVSLVGFMFVNTKVLGLKIPLHTNFEEVNLRFYVRYQDGKEWKRGVVFVKEIVPRAAITFVANHLYHEHYETMKMNHLWQVTPDHRITQYQWNYKNQWQSIRVKSEISASPLMANTEEEFITEHYWGYTKVNPNTTFEYEVSHPRWEIYPVLEHEIDVNFELVYGSSFKLLNELQPRSVMLAEGSSIKVENKRKI